MSLDESSFYITLPSNGKQFEDNTLNNFRVRLPQRIDLEGQWDVALIEAIYPHTWNNLSTVSTDGPHGDYALRFSFSITTPGDGAKVIRGNSVLAKVPEGSYQSPLELVAAINKSLFETTNLGFNPDDPNHVHWPKDVNKIVAFDYNSTTKRVVLRVYKREYFTTMALSPKLRYILGFATGDITMDNMFNWEKGGNNTFHRVAEYPIDLRAGLYAIYVYCSIVEKQIVGDVLVPLLAKMPVSGEYDSVVHYICNQPLYIPLIRTSIDTIEIALKDDIDNGISFQYGKVILTLHFRKRPTFL